MGPLNLMPVFTTASSSVTMQLGRTQGRMVLIDIFLLVPWLLWSRMVVWPMIISEFQQVIQDAVRYEKEMYKEKDCIPP
jgi:hypothetical protein